MHNVQGGNSWSTGYLMIARSVFLALAIGAASFSASAQTSTSPSVGCTLRTIGDYTRTPEEKAATLERCEALAINTALPVSDRENALLALGFAVMNDQPANGERYFDRLLMLSRPMQSRTPCGA